MNKGVAGAVGVGVVLVAGYAGATFWSGQVTEKRHAEQLARVQGEVAGARAPERTYQRGFFTSRSTTSFALGCPEADGKPALRITVTDTIHNGPIAAGTLAAAVIDSQVTLGGSQGERVNAMFTGAPLTVHTVVGFGGKYTSTVQSKAATMAVGAGTVIDWQGLEGTVEGQSGAGDFSYVVKVPGMTITDPSQGAKVTLAGLDLSAESGGAVKGALLMGLGKGRGSLATMRMEMKLPTPPGAPATPMVMSIDGLQFASDTQVAGDLLSNTATLSGTGLFNGAKIDRFEMQASMKRLHAPTYQRLMERAAGAGADCGTAPAAVAAQMVENMQADLMALLAHNPEFALDKLTVDHAGQRGEFAYSIGTQGLTAADAQQPLMASLMKGARLTGSMRLPVAWVRRFAAEGSSRLQGAAAPPEMIDVMLEDAVAKGLVVRDGDFLASRVEYAAGTLTVNGKPMPLGGPPPR